MQDITFGTNLKKMAEELLGITIVVPEKRALEIAGNKIELKFENSSDEEIQAILESLKNPPTKAELEQLEKGGGIEINFENQEGCSPFSKDVVQTDNGLFFKGRRVVLHIAKATYRPNHRFALRNKTDKFHKYHLHYCSALKKQKAKGNLDKYRVSLSKDEKFTYIFTFDNYKKVDDQKLNICGHCLNELGLKENYSLNNFLETQPKTVDSNSSPKFLFDGLNIEGMDFDYNSVPNEYVKNWREISMRRKKEENYTCQECGFVGSSPRLKKYIHTHHMDKQKTNNLSSNLKVLCIKCHFKYHPTLQEKPDYQQFLKIKNSVQIGTVVSINIKPTWKDIFIENSDFSENLYSRIGNTEKLYFNVIKKGRKVRFYPYQVEEKYKAEILEILEDKNQISNSKISEDQNKPIEFEDNILAWVDKSTNLMWEVKNRKNVEHRYVWIKENIEQANSPENLTDDVKDAFSYAEKLNKQNYANFNDWRVPSREELKTILTKEKSKFENFKGYNLYIKNPLAKTSNRYYWSKDTYKSDSSESWVVYFNSGLDNWSYRNNNHFIVCVRDF